MNVHRNNLPLGPSAPIGEILLAETAIRIELPPSLHKLAVERYEAIRKHIERTDSPLFDSVRIFYPQGSMAISATIKSRRRRDGYDIDIVAELILPYTMRPAAILDLLFQAINGAPGSQYRGMVERQTRCVTVYYADGMHLDITPSCLLDENDPRKSDIFHAKPEEPVSRHRRLPMNSYAFCEWFRTRTPIDIDFAKAYGGRVRTFDRLSLKAEAEALPVPVHSQTAGGKSVTVVALQLLKRNRNIRYASRKVRMPPSVMMSCFAGEVGIPGSTISGALKAIASVIQAALERAHSAGRLINVRNPECEEERFTDRWPEDLDSQRLYIDDLKRLRMQLEALMSDELALPQKRDLLVDMFGEGPAQSAVNDYAASLGHAVQTGNRSIARTGRVIPGPVISAPAVIAPALARPADHTFFGAPWKPR